MSMGFSMDDVTLQLQARFGDRLKQGEPMAKHTNFRIGGPARWFLEVKTEKELRDAVMIVREGDARIVIHGGGSNVLYDDGPINALVLVPAFREIEIEFNAPEGLGGCRRVGDGEVVQDGWRTLVTAGAGVLSAMLARKTAEAGLAGLTWMISLPGTVGGAVRGNAGCFGGETKDRLVEVDVLRDGEIKTFSKADLNFGYRESSIKHSNDIVLSAMFEFEAGDPVALQQDLEHK